MTRLEVMTNRIKKDLPEFVELVPPTPKSEGLYRRVRHIQKTGECCGIPMTMDELKQIIALAGRESVREPLLYLCRVLDRVHVEKTLRTARSRLKMDERVRDIARYVAFEAKWQVQYVSDMITGRYSMNDLMCACEIACKKKYPDRYFIKMLKNGLKRPKKLCYN